MLLGGLPHLIGENEGRDFVLFQVGGLNVELDGCVAGVGAD